MRRHPIHLIAAAAIIGLSAQTVPAQDFSMPVIQVAPNFAMSNLNRELLDRRNAEGAQGNVLSSDGQALPGLDKSVLKFTANSGRRTDNFNSFVERIRETDPAGAARLQTLFATSDVMGMIAGAMASMGLDANNVADAYTVWWISAYQASQGSGDTPSRTRYQAVRRQAENALLSSRSLTSASEAEKQQFAEAYLIQAALIDSAVQEMQANPQHLDSLKAAVAQGAMKSGLDLERMILTDNGFRAR
ncbi:DUF6683 family protein [uncultured Roseobacter sp.]|uniref:DUF6683 family protein n=1 Tax=uncultured Roseobacter sp. TaxID=114847 RepID=UPI0026322593|nr:DUF6683 family protein [uncultured Roseobacter sp.]